MESVIRLQRQLVDYTASLFQEGYLDEQFIQLRQLQDESNPQFAVDIYPASTTSRRKQPTVCGRYWV
ncbi:hypothetical protein K1719_033256 [Acacia pycnantha]|nr:hypothetical protein K1719_033256 [Acacia pycnantha]